MKSRLFRNRSYSLRVSIIATVLIGLTIITAHSAESAQSTLANNLQVQNWVAAGANQMQLPSSLYGQIAHEDSAIFADNPCKEMPGSYAVAQACVFGDKSAAPYVVLFGDSFAQMWIPALDQLGRTHHFRVFAFVRYGCVVSSVNIRYWTGAIDPGCMTYRANVLKWINSAKYPPQVLVFSQWQATKWYVPTTASGHVLTPQEWASGLRTTIQSVHSTGIVKVVMLGTPFAFLNPSKCLSAHVTNVRACNSSVSSAYPPFLEARDAATTNAAGGYALRLNKLFCTSVTCPDVVHSILTHANETHVNVHYSQALAPALGELLGCVGSRSKALGHQVGTILASLGGTVADSNRIKVCAVAGG